MMAESGEPPTLPSEVSMWNLQHLTSVGISYAKKGLATPDEVLDGVSLVCDVLSTDCNNLIECMSNLIDFRLPTDEKGISDEIYNAEFGRNENLKTASKRLLPMIESNFENLKSHCLQFQEAASLVVKRYP